MVAAVRVNGQEAGVLWAPPYSLSVGSLLQGGTNTIEVTVSSTSAPKTRTAEWRLIYTEAEKTHGRRFMMQDLDEAVEIESGILVVPYLH